jgi:type II secretory pathway pseudopilin PulG
MLACFSGIKLYLGIGLVAIVLSVGVGVYAKLVSYQREIIKQQQQISILQQSLDAAKASLAACDKTLQKVQSSTQSILQNYGKTLQEKDAYITRLKALLQQTTQHCQGQGGDQNVPSTTSGSDPLLDSLNSLFKLSNVQTNSQN